MRYRRLWRMLLPIGLALLAGCATGSSSPALRPCGALAVRDYPAATQARVADELDAAPVGAAWPDFLVDYGALRAAVKACQAVR